MLSLERGLGLEATAAIALEQFGIGIDEPFW
jgi:hypothetical protein